MSWWCHKHINCQIIRYLLIQALISHLLGVYKRLKTLIKRPKTDDINITNTLTVHPSIQLHDDVSAEVIYGSLRVSFVSKCISQQPECSPVCETSSQLRYISCRLTRWLSAHHQHHHHQCGRAPTCSCPSAANVGAHVSSSVWLRQYTRSTDSSSARRSVPTPAWAQQAGRRPPIQSRHFSAEERLVPLRIQQTGDLANNWRKKRQSCSAAEADKTTHPEDWMSHKLGEKSKPLDFINTRCQLGAESLYIKTWALLQREDFPTELNMLLLLFFFFFFTILQEKIDFLLGAPAVYYMSDLSSFAHNARIESNNRDLSGPSNQTGG